VSSQVAGLLGIYLGFLEDQKFTSVKMPSTIYLPQEKP